MTSPQPSEPSQPAQPSAAPQVADYQRIHDLVQAHFVVEEGFLEHDIPTFHVTLQPNSKQAFLKLYSQLDPMGLAPFFRKQQDKYVLKIVPKPQVKTSRKFTIIALFVVTMGTLLLSGYLLSLGWTRQDPLLGASMFTAAMIAILGAHEMAHKLTANRHKVEATYPYFIPGIPPLGTFGAVIQQKSLAPNRDALFDLGMSGPVIGFILTVLVTIVGVQLSQLTFIPPEGTSYLEVPLLFRFVYNVLPPTGQGDVLMLHPVAYAGYIGMIVTMLNLLPTGMLDGGHVVQVLLGKKARMVLSYAALLALLLIGAWLMAILVFLMSGYPHPGALDEVSQLSTSRKLAAVALIAIFVLTVAPLYTL